MQSQIDLICLIQPELFRAETKELIPLTHSFLNMINKQSPSFNFSHNFHSTYLHLPSIFFQSFFFFAISPLPRKFFLSFSFRASLNCKVASQSGSFKMKSQFYWQNSEKVLRSSVSPLLSAEEELLILISNTILIIVANTLLVPQHP